MFLRPALAALGLALSLWLLRQSAGQGGPSGSGAASACDAAVRGRWSRWCTVPVAMPASLVYLFLLTGFIVLALAPWGALAEMVRTLLFAAVPLLAAAAVWFTGLQLLSVRRVCLTCLLVQSIGLGVAVLIFCDPRMNPNWGFGGFGVDNLTITLALVSGAAIALGQLAAARARSERPAAGGETPVRVWLGVAACAAAVALVACLRLAAENRPAAPRVPTVLLEVTYDIDDATGSFQVTKMGLHSYAHTARPPGWSGRTAILRLGGADPQDETGAGPDTVVVGSQQRGGPAPAGKLISGDTAQVLAVRIWLEARYVSLEPSGPTASLAGRARCGRIEYRLRDQQALGPSAAPGPLAAGTLAFDSKGAFDSRGAFEPFGRVEAVKIPAPAAVFLLPPAGDESAWRVVGKPVYLTYDIARAKLSKLDGTIEYTPKLAVLGGG